MAKKPVIGQFDFSVSEGFASIFKYVEGKKGDVKAGPGLLKIKFVAKDSDVQTDAEKTVKLAVGMLNKGSLSLGEFNTKSINILTLKAAIKEAKKAAKV